jgi:hypothetical protein
VLIARQRATAAYWFARASALDRFEVRAAARGQAPRATLAFDDLMLTAGLADPARTRYEVTTFDRGGHRLGAPATRAADRSGRTVVGPLALAPAADAYTIVRITIVRPDTRATAHIHLARDPATGALRIIGIRRAPAHRP